VLVDFFTQDCVPCRRMAPVLEELAQEQTGRWKIVHVDAAAEPELAVRFRIRFVPALLAFHAGRCVAQRIGARTKQDLLRWLVAL